jgi:hypothetical protein
MHLFDGKKGILRPNNGLVFKLMPYLVAFYLGSTHKDFSTKTPQILFPIPEHFLEKFPYTQGLGFHPVIGDPAELLIAGHLPIQKLS